MKYSTYIGMKMIIMKSYWNFYCVKRYFNLLERKKERKKEREKERKKERKKEITKKERKKESKKERNKS